MVLVAKWRHSLVANLEDDKGPNRKVTGAYDKGRMPSELMQTGAKGHARNIPQPNDKK